MKKKSKSIIISDELHIKLKDFCSERALIMGAFVEKLIDEKIREYSKIEEINGILRQLDYTESLDQEKIISRIKEVIKNE